LTFSVDAIAGRLGVVFKSLLGAGSGKDVGVDDEWIKLLKEVEVAKEFEHVREGVLSVACDLLSKV
jgi:hypothetical protein